MPDRKLLDALHLINSITSALENGTKHFSKSGDLLTTPADILRSLLADGEITFQRPSEERCPMRLLP